MTDTYINEIKQKKEKEALKEEILFGQGMGIVLIIIAGLKYLTTTHIIVEYISIFLFAFGLIILLLGIVFPYTLYYPSKWMKKIINKIFLAVLLIILTMIYLLVLLPVALIKRKKWASDYGFFSWNDDINNIKWKGFSPRVNTMENSQKTEKRTNRIGMIVKIVNYFIERKNFILIPLLCLLLLTGLLFFFVTSSVIIPMIYTLF